MLFMQLWGLVEDNMHSEREIEYLLKGIEAFKKRMIVISPDFEILATNCRSGTDEDADIVGQAVSQRIL